MALLNLFFIAYVLFLWSIFKFSDFFAGNTTNKLKARLQDGQSDLLNKITNHFDTIVSELKQENKQSIKILKKENEKIL